MKSKWIKSLWLPLACVAASVATLEVSAQLFDQKKAYREIKIMSGILETTLQFTVEETHTAWRSSTNVKGYYLYNQGTTFLVSVPGPTLGAVKTPWDVINRDLSEARARELEERVRQAASIHEERSRQRADQIQQRAEQARQRAEQAHVRAEKAAKQAKDKLKERQEAMRENLEGYQEIVDSVRDALVEALGDHGDSLTLVKDDEYINLILVPSSDPWQLEKLFSSSDQARSHDVEVVSIQKSWVKDYKSGRLSLDQFKNKALKY